MPEVTPLSVLVPSVSKCLFLFLWFCGGCASSFPNQVGLQGFFMETYEAGQPTGQS